MGNTKKKPREHKLAITDALKWVARDMSLDKYLKFDRIQFSLLLARIYSQHDIAL